jgi:myo-inositol-1(or 4)-monophosphatase
LPAADVTPDPALAAELALLRETAVEAGRIAMRYFRNDPEVWLKSGTSPVSEADYAVDNYLRDTLLAARPDYGWLSEETVDGAARLDARRTFVVDPIDGTRGFLEGGSQWCVCIAVVEAGEPLAGILECPARGETFWATTGAGAYKNGAPITVRAPGEPIRIAGPKPMFDALPAELRARAHRVAHVPSLAYRLAMVADGALDASFVKANAHDWDIAAADLILREAGGRLLNARGKTPLYGGADIRHGELVAGSGPMLAQIAGVIGACGV